MWPLEIPDPLHSTKTLQLWVLTLHCHPRVWPPSSWYSDSFSVFQKVKKVNNSHSACAYICGVLSGPLFSSLIRKLIFPCLFISSWMWWWDRLRHHQPLCEYTQFPFSHEPSLPDLLHHKPIAYQRKASSQVVKPAILPVNLVSGCALPPPLWNHMPLPDICMCLHSDWEHSCRVLFGVVFYLLSHLHVCELTNTQRCLPRMWVSPQTRCA
jgi:hypothetical protein